MTDYTTNPGQRDVASGATLSALFDSRTEAEGAIERLRSNGVPDDCLRMTEGEDRGATATGATGMQDNRGFFEALGDFLFPTEDRATYAEGLSRGGFLVTVRGLSPDMQETALDVLEDAGAVDIDEREASWRAEGWSGAAATTGAAGLGATAGFAEDRASFDRSVGDNETVPVVEEQLRVGKRDTSHGRVRVRSYVREEPVSEQVDLESERVTIERRPVDRPAGPGDEAFRERSIEAEEYAEEAVVSKEARVVEEIGLGRERDTRTETVSDTVRHTEVEVDDERTGTGPTRDVDRR